MFDDQQMQSLYSLNASSPELQHQADENDLTEAAVRLGNILARGRCNRVCLLLIKDALANAAAAAKTINLGAP